MDLAGAKVLVTGGTGFLGRNVVRVMERAGAKAVGVGSADYDLTSRSEIGRLLDDVKPAAVVHLAAVTGGIGANRSEPGRFFYDNAIMGIELLEACRTHGVDKVVVAGTVCAYPKFTNVPFREDGPLGRLSRGDQRPLRAGQEDAARPGRRPTASSTGSTASTSSPRTSTVPRDNFDLVVEPRDPGPDPQAASTPSRRGRPSVVLWGDGSPTREFLYVADAAGAFVWLRSATTDPSRSTSASGSEISIRDLAEKIASLSGYDGVITWDTSKPNGQPSRPTRHHPGERAVRLPGRHRARRRAGRDRRLVPGPARLQVLIAAGLTWTLPCRRTTPRSVRRWPARRDSWSAGRRIDGSTRWRPSWPVFSSASTASVSSSPAASPSSSPCGNRRTRPWISCASNTTSCGICSKSYDPRAGQPHQSRLTASLGMFPLFTG